MNPTFAIVNILFVSVVKDSSYLKFLPAYVTGTLLGGILSGIVFRYLVMPAIPPYYDNLLSIYKDDIQSRMSLLDSIVEKGSSKSDKESSCLSVPSRKVKKLTAIEEEVTD